MSYALLHSQKLLSVEWIRKLVAEEPCLWHIFRWWHFDCYFNIYNFAFLTSTGSAVISVLLCLYPESNKDEVFFIYVFLFMFFQFNCWEVDLSLLFKVLPLNFFLPLWSWSATHVALTIASFWGTLLIFFWKALEILVIWLKKVVFLWKIPEVVSLVLLGLWII